MADQTKLDRTVRAVECGIIYFTAPLYKQTTAIPQKLFPNAKPGDILTITFEDEKPVKAELKKHVELNSNDK